MLRECEGKDEMSFEMRDMWRCWRGEKESKGRAEKTRNTKQ